MDDITRIMRKVIESRVFLAIVLAVFVIGFFHLTSVYIGLITGSVGEQKLVTKVVDGDTVVIEGGDSVRLLGMDADERGDPCYESAKQRLEELVLNKEVYLESDGDDKDQYGRYLRYLILDSENINLRLVKEGLVIARFYPENVKYREEIVAAEKEAIENRIGCKWSGKTQPPTPSIEGDIVWSEITGNAIAACDAGNYIGEEKIVEGIIADGYKSETNTVFLNFGYPYPDHCFTAVIFFSDLTNFPENPQDYYEGERVRVKGIIKEYKGKPEIILKDASQIEIGK